MTHEEIEVEDTHEEKVEVEDTAIEYPNLTDIPKMVQTAQPRAKLTTPQKIKVLTERIERMEIHGYDTSKLEVKLDSLKRK